MEYQDLTVKEIQRALAQGTFTSVDITRAMLETIDAQDAYIGGYVSVQHEQALAQAAAADQARRDGKAAPLCGVPGAIKDNLCTKGVATTCSSKMLEHFVPPYDATVVERLKAQHMVSLGKANMDEFAMGSSTENSAFQITHNPHDLSRVPGGSSGGSAAIVAAGLAPFALGSDTGGSVRQPASLCGVVGFKPTYGMVSRYGLIAFGSSLDQVGVLSRTVEDCAVVMDAIAGHDERDATSLAGEKPAFEQSLAGGVKGMKIGLPDEYFAQGVSEDVKQSVLAAAQRFEQMGAVVEPCSLPLTPYSLPAYYLLACAEASSNLGRYDGVRYGMRADVTDDWEEMMIQTRTQGFGPEVKRRIMLGTFVLSAGYYDAYYKKAQQARTLIQQDFRKAFDSFDLLLTPTSPTTAWEIGGKVDPLSLYAADICTVAVNIAGLPALSLPCGKDAQGLPIGMQLIGRPGSDAQILRAGHAYEQQHPDFVRPVHQGGAQ